ncbi:MAG: histidine kinase [Chitinophagaceae bacterium]
MGKFNIRYWSCQILGWGIWGAINYYFSVVIYGDWLSNLFGSDPEKLQRAKLLFHAGTLIFVLSGILITHIFRAVLKRIDWLKFSLVSILVFFAVIASVSGIGIYYLENFVEAKTNLSIDQYIQNQRLENAKLSELKAGLSEIDYYSAKKDSLTEDQKKSVETIKRSGWSRNAKGEWKQQARSNLGSIYQTIILSSLWFLLYLFWHFFNKNRKDQLDKLKLETTVKELELKTIKSHINPHFIFNSLNSIRALVDENPERARTAITELSNILRSSMQAEKSETVTLQRELDIVKDYLALEHMRFEERLRVTFNIAPETLNAPVPPMMLQTLVENAIKHGISKQVHGGDVIVTSCFNNHNLELMVKNTGSLSAVINEDGFGIKSTQDRLNLMYQGKAVFEIRNTHEEMVESKITIPLPTN